MVLWKELRTLEYLTLRMNRPFLTFFVLSVSVFAGMKPAECGECTLGSMKSSRLPMGALFSRFAAYLQRCAASAVCLSVSVRET